MSSTLNDTIGTARNVMGQASEGAAHAVEDAKHAFGTARDGVAHAASSVRTTWLEDVKAVTSAFAMLRSLTPDDALGWVGLARRRSPLVSMGIFGAGIALGAGVGMLFAPMSGLEMRRAFVKRFTGAGDEPKGPVDGKEPAAKADGTRVASDGAAPPMAGSPSPGMEHKRNHVS